MTREERFDVLDPELKAVESFIGEHARAGEQQTRKDKR
jgi:threonine synthase